MNDKPTRALAQFASELTYEKIPSSVIERMKLCLLDTFGCGLFGSTLPWAIVIADFAQELGGKQESIIWGRNVKVSAPNAALANGTAVHSFELDDLHKTSIVHPGGIATTSALAMAERIGHCSGKDLLTAIVAGYEVAIRVGMSVGTSHLQRGFHPTGTHGAFGAGAAAGRILRLDTEKMTHDLGIAGTQAAGLMAAQYSAMVKRMHAGRAAQSGVYGALLAQKGFTGIVNILEAEYGGYCKVMADVSDMSKLTSGLGKHYETSRVGFKPYAAGGSTHTAHEAVKAVMEKNNLSADSIDKITIRATTATYHHTSWEYKPEGVTAAQMNMQYVVAITALEGDIFINQFTEAKVQDPKIIEYSRRVEVIPDPELDKLGPEFRHVVIAEIRTRNGKMFHERVDTAKGSDKRPMSADEINRKYQILASKALNQHRVAELKEMVFSLEKVSDVREVAELLIP
ncbi:MAG: MmgE/PrpD family protein [Thermodesulfobacteriota bacterium]|nr:MmgE/PrpD family protein [Thermodesulfobacteriota bacterium]